MKKTKLSSLFIGAAAAIALTITPVAVANAASSTYFNGKVVADARKTSSAKKHYQNSVDSAQIPGCLAGSKAYTQIVENKTKGKITGPTQVAQRCSIAGTGAGTPLSGTVSKCWWSMGVAGAQGNLKCKTWW